MIRTAFRVSLPAVFLVAMAAGAEPEPGASKEDASEIRGGALDAISTKAAAAIAIRNIDELKTRGDRFIDETELEVPFRLSEGYALVTGYLGIKRGLDDKGSAALMGFDFDRLLDSLVLAVPFADRDAIAGNFGIGEKALAGGAVVERETHSDNLARFLAVRGKHLFLGMNKAAIERPIKGKLLAETLSEDDRRLFDNDDILLYGNAARLPDDQRSTMFGNLESLLKAADPADAPAARDLAAAATDLQFALAGIRLEGGLGGTAVIQFEGETSREILTRLRGEEAASTLSGLPAGRAIAAHATSGNGAKTASVARVVLDAVLREFLPAHDFISSANRPSAVGLFGELWERLEGSRSALYENESPAEDGAFAIVAILDTRDAERFIADMTGLARFVSAAGLSLDDNDPERISAAEVRKLIDDLAADEYAVRQAASTRLGLIGKAALPEIEKAAESRDLEQATRAKLLRQTIMAAAAEERRDLLEQDLLGRIRPRFAYFPREETRAGRPVDIVSVRLTESDAGYAERLRSLLGPDWSRIRLATIGRRVIVLVGSNTELFEAAIENVRSGAAGLAGDERFAGLKSREGASRAAEFHLSLARIQQLAGGGGDVSDKAASVSSFGLVIEPDRIRVDLFAPFDEVKSVVKGRPWF